MGKLLKIRFRYNRGLTSATHILNSRLPSLIVSDTECPNTGYMKLVFLGKLSF